MADLEQLVDQLVHRVEWVVVNVCHGKDWRDMEMSMIAKCDGSSKTLVREWMQSLRVAAGRVPPGEDVQATLKILIQGTARGELQREVEGFLGVQANRAATPYAAILTHVAGAFLGPDEEDYLIAAVKKISQGAREPLLSYCRRFRKAAMDAYPLPWDAATDRKLTEMFMPSLINGKPKDKVFAADNMVTLGGACDTALQEELRWERRKRLTAGRRDESPMEVDAADHEVAATRAADLPMRELLTDMTRTLRAVESKMATLQRHQSDMETTLTTLQSKSSSRDATPAAPARSSKPRSGSGPECYRCRQRGHIQRDCPQARGQRGPSRSQTPKFNQGE
jgi:hypothetical protein